MRMSTWVPLTQQQFVGNHYQWNNLPGGNNEFRNLAPHPAYRTHSLKIPTWARSLGGSV
jgi:hypothetical protein